MHGRLNVKIPAPMDCQVRNMVDLASMLGSVELKINHIGWVYKLSEVLLAPLFVGHIFSPSLYLCRVHESTIHAGILPRTPVGVIPLAALEEIVKLILAVWSAGQGSPAEWAHLPQHGAHDFHKV